MGRGGRFFGDLGWMRAKLGLEVAPPPGHRPADEQGDEDPNGNQHLVPPKYVDTIQYPAPVPKPTITDLAKDRIARIKDARPKCYP